MLSNINMKKIVLILTAIMVASFIIAGSTLVVNGVENTFLGRMGLTKEQNINVEKTFALSGIKDVNVSTVSTDITVIPVDSNEFKVHFYGTATSSSKNPAPELVSAVNGSTLNIEVKYKIRISIGINYQNNHLKLDIYAPKSYSENLKANTVSGTLKMDGLSLNQLRFNTVSGELVTSSVNTKAAKFNSTSGSLESRGFTGDLDFDSVSGSADIEYSTFNNDITAHTTSGSFSIKLPQDSQFNIDFNSVSGDFRSDFPVTTSTSGKHRTRGSVGSSSNDIEFDSVSGDAEINK